jgi:hypothetical protein
MLSWTGDELVEAFLGFAFFMLIDIPFCRDVLGAHAQGRIAVRIRPSLQEPLSSLARQTEKRTSGGDLRSGGDLFSSLRKTPKPLAFGKRDRRPRSSRVATGVASCEIRSSGATSAAAP